MPFVRFKRCQKKGKSFGTVCKPCHGEGVQWSEKRQLLRERLACNFKLKVNHFYLAAKSCNVMRIGFTKGAVSFKLSSLITAIY